MGFGGGHEGASEGLNSVELFGPSGTHKRDSWLPCCEWYNSHGNVVSHAAWQAYMHGRHLLQQCPSRLWTLLKRGE